MRRIVLDPGVPRESIETVADECGWTLHRAAGPETLEPYNATWRTAQGGDSVVHYVEDDLLFARYVVINGRGAGEAATAIEQRLDTVTVDAAIRRFAAAQTPEELSQALVEAVIAADPDLPQPAVAGVIQHALADRLPDVRRTAIAACAYLNWKELDVLLTQVIDRDPDPDVVRFARDARALRRRYGGAAA